ncbi:MAG: apurinic endonuclease Apn1 [Planctomycetaceae bacterium]|nr:apurinic endonuclease Apn1 [Planctomycetaceae bacterium]
MPPLGAHMSIAGGYYKAVEAAATLEMDCVQLFTKNNNQWAGKPISTQDVEDFKNCLKQLGIQHPVAHDSYLINLASPDDALWAKSRDAFAHELERAEGLGLIGVVMHPGAAVGSTPEDGLARIVTALDAVHESTAGVETLTLLETTAGQGTTLGAKFEELAWIIDHVQTPDRIGVCVDTCHIFAAGYPLIEAADYKATFAEFDRLIGVSRIKAFHLNDSLKPFGSRVDRHAHIGRGTLGLEPFRHLLNDKRFTKVPMYLETNKGEEDGEDLDAINLRTLKSLVKSRKT